MLRLSSVSPYVEPTGTWIARFDVVGVVPIDSTLTISVRRPLTGSEASVRARMAQVRSGDNLTSPLQSQITRSMSGILTPSSLTVELPIRPRAGDPTRVLVPNEGVHPVVIELDAGDGSSLYRGVLFLNRLPSTIEANPAAARPAPRHPLRHDGPGRLDRGASPTARAKRSTARSSSSMLIPASP